MADFERRLTDSNVSSVDYRKTMTEIQKSSRDQRKRDESPSMS